MTNNSKNIRRANPKFKNKKSSATDSNRADKKINTIKHHNITVNKKSYNTGLYFNPKQRRNEWLTQFYNKFTKNLEAYFYLKNDSKILIAVSGGVDSVVLLDLFFQLTEIRSYQINVCHFNHKIRPVSAEEDEEFVRKLSNKYGVNFYSDSADVKDYAKRNNQSTELAARNLRYKFFERIAKSIDANYVALAHTSNDVAETVLFNLIRGTGLTGLSGIPKIREQSKKVRIIRPILDFKKEDLIKYATIRELTWREDETNTLTIYTRNKIRNELLKKIESDYNPQIIETLSRTAALISSADNYVKEHIKPLLKSAKWNKETLTLTLQIQLLKSADTYIQGEIIQFHLEDKFKISGLSLNTIDRIISLSNFEIGSIVEIRKDIIALRDRNQIVISRNNKDNNVNLDIKKTGIFNIGQYQIRLEEVTKKQVIIDDNPKIEFFDYDKIPALLTIRNWKYGDSFKALGMSGKTKISDFLINKKVSLFDKMKVLVLASKSEIVWVCGYRINDDYKINDNTSRFLKATFEIRKKKD